ncbi:MAG TPA: 30S ribosomal protein S6 [Gaiellaceae bacterium]|nr:30S ribosomal protein S6 [Gaiellaceae bacterium]
MNDYEVLLMLDPELPEERGNEIIARIREQAESGGGSWDAQEPWGRRRLAYEIDHKAEGVYHLLLFTAAPTALEEITRVLKITDGVMRHLAVRRVKGGSIKAPAPIAAVSTPVAEAAPTAPPAAEPTAPEPEPEAENEAVSEAADDADAAAE